MSIKALDLLRPAIREMKAYESARFLLKENETTGVEFLDANECPYEPIAGVRGYARYPDQQPVGLVRALAQLYDVDASSLMVTRGADEGINILVRAFCEKGENIIVCPPTFPVYEIAATIQGAQTRHVPLLKEEGFQMDLKGISKAADSQTKMIFVCSPNNPTGNLMNAQDITTLAKDYDQNAMVIVDETYLDYTEEQSAARMIADFPNIIVLRTISKSHASAGLRCGSIIAHVDLIGHFLKILDVYPFSRPMIEATERILYEDNLKKLSRKRREILDRRNAFIKDLANCRYVDHVYPTDANFVLVKLQQKNDVLEKVSSAGIFLRDQSSQPGLEDCVRVSIGSQKSMHGLLRIFDGQGVERPASARVAHITRNTKETRISVDIDLDNAEPVNIHTGIGFYDHMLEQIAKHGGFSINLECKGDLHIDSHHTIEDCAIALGQGLKKALGDKTGIQRYGFSLPMDESRADVVLDLSGRAYLKFEAVFPDRQIGEMPADMVEHIFRALAENLGANIHIKVEGENTHHMVEACFKAFGRALRQAISYDQNLSAQDIFPSTKGVI